MLIVFLHLTRFSDAIGLKCRIEQNRHECADCIVFQKRKVCDNCTSVLPEIPQYVPSEPLYDRFLLLDVTTWTCSSFGVVVTRQIALLVQSSELQIRRILVRIVFAWHYYKNDQNMGNGGQNAKMFIWFVKIGWHVEIWQVSDGNIGRKTAPCGP